MTAVATHNSTKELYLILKWKLTLNKKDLFIVGVEQNQREKMEVPYKAQGIVTKKMEIRSFATTMSHPNMV